MTDYERGYEQGKADALKKMHPEIRKCLEDYFGKCFQEYAEHRRKWVGLTDEDKAEILSRKWWNFEDEFDLAGFLGLAESILREKNGG
jgi:hypothetical protein